MTEIQTNLWKTTDITGNIFFLYLKCKVKHYSTVVSLTAPILEKIKESVRKISRIF